PSPPWSAPRGIDAVLEGWHASGAIERCFAAERSVAPREGRFAQVPEGLTPGLASALATRGVRELYSHQREAIDAARSGRHVVVATPTASGKSLCFHVPVLDALSRDDS